ncbi:MAG: hypothetical protein HY827_06965 [Actinobacteria bacterium]|nr:hypothetical protein [Actinomycetota bacterium]
MPETRELPEVINLLGDEIERALERLEIPAAAREESGRVWRFRRWPVRSRAWKRLTVAAVAVSVISVAVTYAGSLWFGQSPLTTEAAVARVAKATLNQTEAGPRQLTYSRFAVRTLTPYPSYWLRELPKTQSSQLVDSRPFDAFTERTSETWISLRSTGFVVDHRGVPSYPTDVDRERGERYLRRLRAHFKRAGRTFHFEEGAGRGWAVIRDDQFNPLRTAAYGFDPAGRVTIGGEALTWHEVLDLPTDPRRLLNWLEALPGDYAGPKADEAWVLLAGSYLPGYGVPLPVKLRAAFVEALALVPGVQVRGERTDRFGRVGLVFAHDFSGLRQELMFDKKTGTLLSSTTTLTGGDRRMQRQYGNQPTGTVIESFTLIEQRVVNRLPAAARRVLRADPPKRR